MRRILCFTLALLMLNGLGAAQEERGAAGENALLGMTLEELYALRERVDERIAQLENPEQRPFYESGTYRVGVDIPEGVYLLVSDEVALFPGVLVRASDGQDSAQESVRYELVLSTAVMRLVSGSFVTLTDVTAYPFEQAPEAGLDAGGAASEGGYWVGRQIPAGDYRITPMEKPAPASYSVYDDVPGADAQMIRFEVIDASVDLRLEAGQYISLSGCALLLMSAGD